MILKVLQKTFPLSLSLVNGQRKTKTKTRKANEEGTLQVKVEGAMSLLNPKPIQSNNGI